MSFNMHVLNFKVASKCQSLLMPVSKSVFSYLLVTAYDLYLMNIYSMILVVCQTKPIELEMIFLVTKCNPIPRK